MSQDKIQEILKEMGEPIPARVLAELLETTVGHINKQLKPMIKYKEISYIELYGKEAYQQFKVRRKMRLYYIK